MRLVELLGDRFSGSFVTAEPGKIRLTRLPGPNEDRSENPFRRANRGPSSRGSEVPSAFATLQPDTLFALLRRTTFACQLARQPKLT